MKTFMIVAIFFVGLSAFVAADRPKSKAVLATMNSLRPRYREIQDFVIETLADARLSSSAKLNVFHEDVLRVKETLVTEAIVEEDKMIFQIDNQPSTENALCLSFVRDMVTNIMNLAGTGFATCITEASDALTVEVNKFYAAMQKDESEYAGIGLLNVFKDENIFNDPEKILTKLSSKSGSLEQYPTSIQDEVTQWVAVLGTAMDGLEQTYITCMTDSEQRLKTGFELAKANMIINCKAVEVTPAAQSVLQVAPGTVIEPKSDFRKIFHERFGL